MGLRSAFNPLGALPYTAPASTGYTISWKVNNIPLVDGDYILPVSWVIDGGTANERTVATSALDRGTVTTDTQHSGCYVVPLTYTATGSDTGSHTVTTTDPHFTVTGN